MTTLEIFENLMLPLKAKLGEESWNFLISRGEKFIEQINSQNSGKPLVSGSAVIDYSGYEESLKAELKDAVEQQEQQQREEFNAGREAALSYAVEMLPKHLR